MGHTDPLKQARATPREQQQQKPKASINKMQHIRRIQHLCGIYCEPRERVEIEEEWGWGSERATARCPLEAYKVFMLQIVAYFVAYWRTLSSGKWQMGYDCTRAGVQRERVGRGGVRCTVIGCPNKALCKRWRSLIAICLNVCYTIFQRLTLCNPSSYPTHSLPLSLHPFHSLLLSAVA